MAKIHDVYELEDRATATLDRIDSGYRKVEQSQSATAVSAAAFMDAFDAATASGEDFAKACEAATAASQAALNPLEETVSELQNEATAATEAAEGVEELAESTDKSTGRFRNWISSLKDTHTPLDGITAKIRRMALSLFTARRLLTYVRNALKRAPAEISEPWNKFTSAISDTFAQTVLSITRGLLPALDRLTKKLESENGQKVIKALAQAFELAGIAAGYLVDMISRLIDWISGHMDTVLIATAALLTIFAVKMIAAGVAAAVANAPMLIMIGVIGILAGVLSSLGVTGEQVFTAIGTAAGALYATIYNIIAQVVNNVLWLWNDCLAPFAEAFGTMLDNPVQGIIHLLTNLASFAISILGKIAGAIDALFGSNLSAAVAGWKEGVDNWAAEKFASAGSLGRAGYLDYKDIGATASAWGGAAGGLANKFSSTSLGGYQLNELQDINANTGATAKAVNMAEEDLKDFVDMATRDYVVRVNLATNAPNITINGQNTGNTKQDAENVAGIIAKMLTASASSSSMIPSTAFTGG